MIALVIIGYIILAAAIVYLSIMLSNYVDMLDKTTNLSGALLGGILLAMVTSLPELFTTLTAVIGVGETDYVLGNILGSDIFDIIVLGALFIVFIKNTIHTKMNKSNITQLLCLIGSFIAIGVATFLPSSVKQYIVLGGWFNVLTFAVIAIYVLSLIIMPKTKSADEEENKEEEDEKSKVTLSIKQIVIRFSIFSVLLIGCSIGVTYLSDMIVKEFKIDVTLAGALLLGVMTSLPELISTANLFYKKNIDAGTGNIVGSCIFNTMIICIGELFSFKASVYIPNPEVNKLIIFGFIAIVATLAIVIINIKVKTDNLSSKGKIIKASSISLLSAISVACYLLYLFMPGNMFNFVF